MKLHQSTQLHVVTKMKKAKNQYTIENVSSLAKKF